MSAPPAAGPVVTLYTRPGCGPCRLVEDALAHLSRRYPHTLHVVDITRDAAVEAALGDHIPVVDVGDRRLHAPITIARLIAALRDAG